MARWSLRTLHLLLLLLERGAAHRDGAPGVPRSEASPRVITHGDAASVSMFQLYEKYSKDPRSSRREGNTVRSFRGVPRVLHGKDVLQFNLSSIPHSEIVLLASLHFLQRRPRQHQRSWRFRRPRHSHGGQQHLHPPHTNVLFHGSSPDAAMAKPIGNLTLVTFDRGSWQTGDITAIVKHARHLRELVMTVEFDVVPEAGPLLTNPPYILVYADDTAIDEPNSVAVTLQRYGPSPVGERVADPPPRIRRELQVQTNDIPEVHFSALKNHELWQSTYFPDKAKAGRRQDQAGREGGSRKPQVLNFDEKTMKKARRRQWSEPRVCSRRYLKVDFADIGWSEWVLAPKSFDAFYCAGACGFPIPTLTRPSNHATIQSIVRAVGIVPGIPEPCCVPDRVSPLSVLFLDPDRNMVLKVYPGMSVDTCACR